MFHEMWSLMKIEYDMDNDFIPHKNRKLMKTKNVIKFDYAAVMTR